MVGPHFIADIEVSIGKDILHPNHLANNFLGKLGLGY